MFQKTEANLIIEAWRGQIFHGYGLSKGIFDGTIYALNNISNNYQLSLLVLTSFTGYEKKF